MLEYRTIQADDFPDIAKWNVELHQDEGSVPMEISDAEARLERWFTEGNFGGMVFTHSGEAIGYLIYEELAPNPDLRGSQESLYIRQFFIARNVRRMGHGRAAFRLFQETFNASNMPIVLDVKATNPNGHKFWASMSFEAQHTNYKSSSP